MDATGKLLCTIYGLLAMVALLGTWSQNFAFMALPDNGGAVGFIRAAFVNPASASLAIDLLVVAIAACVWMLAEAQRLGIRFVFLYIVLSVLIGISVMFPLFLIARQLKLPQDSRLRLP